MNRLAAAAGSEPGTGGWHRFLAGYTAPYRAPLTVSALLVVARAAAIMAAPWPIKLAVDHVLPGRPMPGPVEDLAELLGASTTPARLAWLAAASLVLALVTGAVRVAEQVQRRSTGLAMANDLAADTLELVQRQSPASPTRLPPGELIQRVCVDARCLEVLVYGVWLTGVGAVVTFVLLGGVVATMSATVLVTVGAVASAIGVVVRLFHRRMQDDADALAAAEGSLAGSVEEMLATVPEIQSFGAEAAQLAAFTHRADRRVAAAVRVQWSGLQFRSLLSLVSAAGSSAVLAVGGLEVLNGDATLGELLVVVAYLASLFGPVEDVAHLAQGLASARAGAQRLLELSSLTDAVPEPVKPHPFHFNEPALSVTLRDVTFGYRPQRPVLRGIHLDIRPGETVAIVGPSGAGKSTLAGLVPRLYDPWTGAVRVAGVDVRTVAPRALRRHVAVVHQDPVLLPISVRDNIAYGRPGATDADIRRAAERALAAEFIGTLPDGYDTVLGEGGATLSGGQRQRLAIARALCRDAPVLVLDEPTAALDAESEEAVMRLLTEAAGARTILVIAHRLTTLRRADHIAVLDGGRLVESGSHEALLRTMGLYARYHTLQSGSPAYLASLPDAAGRLPTEG